MEKLEFLYLSPYYLQAAFFMIGTLAWFLSEAIFKVRLPFWTSLWGWSLVFTNLFSLPLMNTVGLFLEESEERDYGGILSFIVLSYLIVPFQGYAALKGFLEKEEGPWFRTPKTGRITDIFTPGRFARFISAIFPGRKPASTPSFLNPILALATANNRFENFRISKKQARWVGKTFLVILIIFSTLIPFAPSAPYFVKSKQVGAFSVSSSSADHESLSASTSPTSTPSSVPSSMVFSSPTPTLILGSGLSVKKRELKKHDFKASESVELNLGSDKMADLKISIFDNQKQELEVQIQEEKNNGENILKVLPLSSFKPGKYKLRIIDLPSGQVSEQDFTWGVLAINTNKSIYPPNEKAKLALAVLDEQGMMVCDASLHLKIKTPEGESSVLSTDGGTIKVNPECQIHDFTAKPDYEAEYQVGRTGKYELELEAETKAGIYTVNDSFEAQKEVAFDVERNTATRIYPVRQYPVNLTIVPGQDFNGVVEEVVPESFEIKLNTQNARLRSVNLGFGGQAKIISWEVDWKRGEKYQLSYEFDAPDISPYLYLLGPLKIGDPSTGSGQVFEEARRWQIAVDLVVGDARVTYADSTVASPNQIRGRSYTGSDNRWNPEGSISQTSGTTINFVVDEASPTRNEHLVGIWEQSGSGTTLRIFRWNGSAWSAEWSTTTANTTLGTYTRPFDIAYEKSSGDAIVVYSTAAATTNELARRVWNGLSWVGPTDYDVVGTTALVCGIELESRPSSDRIAMVYTVSAATNSLNTAVWNGGGWESNPSTALEAGVMEPGTACQSKAYDIAWEESSGEILAAWGQGTTADVWEYSACTGGPPCTWGATAQAGTEEGTVLDMATQPGTDHIGISVLSNNGNDEGGGYWDGSSFTSTATPDALAADPDATLGQRSVGVGWLTSGATTKGVLIYADTAAAGTGVDYALIEAGVVNLTETQCGTTPPAVLDTQTRVVQDPADSSKFLALIEDANSDLWAIRFTFDGTTVTCADTNAGVALNANLTSATSQPFDFSYDLPRAPFSPIGSIQYNATHETVIPIGGSTTDGITTNIYLDFDVGGNDLTEVYTPKVEVRDTSTAFSNVSTNTGSDVIYNPADPPARRSHSAIYDSANKRMIIFGGWNGTTQFDDTWELKLPANESGGSQWRKLIPTGTAPPARRLHSAIYDSANQRMIVFGGYTTVDTNLVYSLTLPSSGDGAWSQIYPSGTLPSARSNTDAIYDPVNGRMVVFGGYGAARYQDVWQLTLTSGAEAWIERTPGAGAPSIRGDYTAVYNSSSQKMIVFGGYNGSTYYNDVYTLSVATPGSEAWATLSPTGTLPATRSNLESVYDPDNNRMIVYQGWNGSTYYNDVWELTLGAGSEAWTDKSPEAGSRPAGTYGCAGIYDSFNKKMLVYGGNDSSNKVDRHTISLDLPAAGSFTYKQINKLTYLQGRDAQGAIFDSLNNQMVMFGGYGRIYDSSDLYSGEHLNEAWGFSNSTGAWTNVNHEFDGPTAREGTVLVYDSLNDRAIMFGGLSGQNIANNTFYNDVWELTLSSSGEPLWRKLSPTGTKPSARWLPSAVYDSLNQRLVIAAGEDSGASLNDVWALSLPSGDDGAWSPISPSGTPPSVRAQMATIYDSANQRMLMFGGGVLTGSVSYFNEVWELSLVSGAEAWANRTPVSGNPTARRGATCIYDNAYAEKRMVCFGGWNGTATTFNELWKMNVTTPGSEAWAQITANGPTPDGRRSHIAVYDSQNQRMLMYGGRPVNPPFFNDTWTLSLESATTSWTWAPLDPNVYLRASVIVSGLTLNTSYHWQAWFTGTNGDSAKVSYGENLESEADLTVIPENVLFFLFLAPFFLKLMKKFKRKRKINNTGGVN